MITKKFNADRFNLIVFNAGITFEKLGIELEIDK